MEKRVKYGGILLILLTLGLIIYGYFYGASDRTIPTAAVKNAIPVTATDLIRLSNKDEAQFNHQYLNKVLSVRGVIRRIRKSRSGITVLLEGHPATPEAVSCTLDTLYNRSYPEWKTGDSCTIQGNCAGLLKDIILIQCIIEPD